MIYKISPIEWSEPDKKFKVTVITGPHEYNVQNVLSPVRAALENYIQEITEYQKQNARTPQMQTH